MKEDSLKRFLWLAWRLLRIALPLSLVAAGVVAGICWWSGHRSWQEYSEALHYAAILALVAGGAGFLAFSGVGARRGTVPPEGWQAYAQERKAGLNREVSYFLTGLLVALLLYILAVIVALVAPV